jgi:hypothetical protein
MTMANPTRLRLVALLLLPAVVDSFSLAASRVAVPTKLVRYSSDSSASDESAEDWFNDTEDSLQQNVKSGLKAIDKNVLKRVIRIGNHVPTLISLVYFGT